MATAEQALHLRHADADGRPPPDRQRGNATPGISVLVREGAVIGHYDKMKVPAWVMMRWTEEDYRASEAEKYNARKFGPDHELPSYARADTKYDFATSKMTRGHMARQQDNKAWGSDNVGALCLMSNIVPQHESMNGGVWGEIEDEHRRVVIADNAKGIKAVWAISGPLFRKPGETEDKPLMTVGNDVGVPWATYKVIGWFDRQNRFNARGFVVPQDVPKSATPRSLMVPVDQIEQLTGLDFFSELDDGIETRVEAAGHADLWR